MSLHIYPANSL
jgi:DNA replication regulator DPB11